MTLVETAPHEVRGHLVYAQNGADPYWLLGKLLIEGLGGYAGNVPVVLNGQEWEVMFTDTDGGLAPWAEDPVNQPLNEYQIKARGNGQRKLTFDVKPRWAGLHAWDSGEQVITSDNSQPRMLLQAMGAWFIGTVVELPLFAGIGGAILAGTVFLLRG